MKHRQWPAILLLLLATCTPPKLVSPTPTPIVGGLGDIPADQYLFVEYWKTVYGGNSNNPTGECSGYSWIDEPTYEYKGGRLIGDIFEEVPKMGSIRVILGRGEQLSGGIGSGIASRLYAVGNLPFPISNIAPLELIILGFDKRGAVLIRAGDESVWLAPGESWRLQEEDEPEPGCHRRSIYRFTNYGLLNSKYVDVGW
jgi:hypothetical protein